jgi:uncharacterized protein (UPF0303 family)
MKEIEYKALVKSLAILSIQIDPKVYLKCAAIILMMHKHDIPICKIWIQRKKNIVFEWTNSNLYITVSENHTSFYTVPA